MYCWFNDSIQYNIFDERKKLLSRNAVSCEVNHIERTNQQFYTFYRVLFPLKNRLERIYFVKYASSSSTKWTQLKQSIGHLSRFTPRAVFESCIIPTVECHLSACFFERPPRSGESRRRHALEPARPCAVVHRADPRTQNPQRTLLIRPAFLENSRTSITRTRTRQKPRSEVTDRPMTENGL